MPGSRYTSGRQQDCITDILAEKWCINKVNRAVVVVLL